MPTYVNPDADWTDVLSTPLSRFQRFSDEELYRIDMALFMRGAHPEDLELIAEIRAEVEARAEVKKRSA